MTYGKTIQELRAEYAPYDKMQAFDIGMTDYANGRGFGPHHYRGVEEQAYDRSVECAMRYRRVQDRFHDWEPISDFNNVGAD